ncbi:outer membrane protein assembly factor BamA [Sulfitobacter sp. JL08]|uniref:outer membrane protein assembly factor BamA n=1 Tax=Sulfitobacter sp. JL08 TaxID=2070369 RepID=UPI0020C82401|nr:outer membrane protein assembly factor BamA [Sulfitobacter sp. JL08]
MTFAVSPRGAQAQNYTFSNIDIQGNKRIEDIAILTYAGITRGQTITAGELNDVYRRIEDSGVFETVELDPRGNTLVITVTERPTVNQINFEGNSRVRDNELRAIVGSTQRRVFIPEQAERDAAAIADVYAQEGRLAAKVTPKIIRLSDNRVDLVFEILEGDTIEIERLTFVGNRAYTDRRLRQVLGTKQAGLLRALIRSDTLIEDRIEFDKQLLTDFYQSRGYVDFRINSVNAELSRERDGYFLVFNIQEGQQFRFGQITTVSEMPGVDAQEYQDNLKVKPGVVYSPTLVENSIARMERLGIANGVDFMRIDPRITRNDRDLTLDVEFALVKGPRIFVERIDIEGNTTTLDQVVRRQFRIVEGDPFNPREIRESAERIRALGYFSSADVEAREGSSPDQVIVDVDVEELPTGALNFGGSFSTSDGFGILISFREDNFLGRGQRFGIDLSTAQEAQRYGFSFTEPALLGRDLSLGVAIDFFENENSYASYDVEKLIFRPELSFPVSDNGRVSFNYKAERTDMNRRTPREDGVVIGNEINVGEQWTSSIGYVYSYDSRRVGLNPNAGYLFEFGQDFAGIGGDNEYVRTQATAIAQTKVLNEEVTLRATLEGGMLNWLSGTSRVTDRFLLDPSTMRGFETGGIGPRDQTLGASDGLGGNLFVVARFEAEFPLGLPEELGIMGGVFYDVGNLWDLSDVNLTGGNIIGESGSFRHVVGVSLFWETPLGPLRFNFSNALVKESFDDEQQFDLTISARF